VFTVADLPASVKNGIIAHHCTKAGIIEQSSQILSVGLPEIRIVHAKLPVVVDLIIMYLAVPGTNHHPVIEPAAVEVQILGIIGIQIEGNMMGIAPLDLISIFTASQPMHKNR
jgi:hypothetical protein